MPYSKSSAFYGALLSGLALMTTPAGAQSACPVAVAARMPCPQEAWQTVGIEHADRMARLKRLSKGRQGFSFFEETVSPSEHGLKDFPADIPVLRVVAQQDIFFDSGSDQIRPEAYKLLDIVADSLKQEPPDVVLFVAGHTDADGEEDYNIDLGLSRAHAVASALVLRGVYQASIYRVSFGEYMPIAPNDTVRRKAKNRRVEFLFGAKPEALVVDIKRQNVNLCSGDNNECKKQIRIEIEKVSVSRDFEKKIVEINNEVKAIEKQSGRSPVEITKERQEVELERTKIPVEIDRQKIYVDLGR
ncbi:OmpA/MotB family outer membrane protein (plasmid) [Rhizobium etli]|uniref:OmpA/MotB family outer membrane protein n=1 Tax=Rhizobium etli TaxID=29449 RepID=A0AAN1BLY8_RHIET|nr:OmpA family protein [Rhizobium etli]ARQ13508.1 OmpA/MotB family outer membrane protein [Rhizobium etli]